MDGWTACKLMKDMLKIQFAMTIPVIGVTGADIGHNKEKFIESGMDGMIQKPICKEDMRELLRTYTGK